MRDGCLRCLLGGRYRISTTFGDQASHQVINTQTSYVPAPDAKHFLVNMALEKSPPIYVIRNWTAGLKD